MGRYVAFLRAINLGPTRKVSMARLKELFADLGYEDVETFINSGNVAFDASGGAAALETAIEDRLHGGLGFEVDTFVRTAKQIRDMADHDAFPKARRSEADRVHVLFLKRKPPASVTTLSTDDDLLALGPKEVWWLRRGQMMASTLPKDWGDDLGPGTMRTQATLQRIGARL